MLKNLVYIATKEQKINSELTLLQSVDNVQLVGVGKRDAGKALAIKQYQKDVLEYIKTAEPEILKENLEAYEKQLCVACREGLSSGVIGCGRELKRFVLCDMLRRSLI